jgi:calcium-dependent protein kinase
MWTRTGCVFYAAPEIFREESVGYNEKVDIWSVAVILYQLATKTLPFQEETIIDTIESILRKELSFKDESLLKYS